MVVTGTGNGGGTKSAALERIEALSFTIRRRLADYRAAVNAAHLATQRARNISTEIDRLERARDAARSQHLDAVIGRVRHSEPLVSLAAHPQPLPHRCLLGGRGAEAPAASPDEGERTCPECG